MRTSRNGPERLLSVSGRKFHKRRVNSHVLLVKDSKQENHENSRILKVGPERNEVGEIGLHGRKEESARRFRFVECSNTSSSLKLEDLSLVERLGDKSGAEGPETLGGNVPPVKRDGCEQSMKGEGRAENVRHFLP